MCVGARAVLAIISTTDLIHLVQPFALVAPDPSAVLTHCVWYGAVLYGPRVRRLRLQLFSFQKYLGEGVNGLALRSAAVGLGDSPGTFRAGWRRSVELLSMCLLYSSRNLDVKRKSIFSNNYFFGPSGSRLFEPESVEQSKVFYIQQLSSM
jgi:hypothetical protein